MADSVTTSTVIGPPPPTELVREIINLATQPPDFGFLQPDWAERLYSHVVLPSPEAGRAFVRTLQSDRWQTEEMVTEAGEWIRAITFGQKLESGDKIDGTFIGEVVEQVTEMEIDRVAIVGVNIKSHVLTELLYARYLQLDHVTVAVYPTVGQLAPSVTHLHISDTDSHRHLPVSPYKLTNFWPLLTHIISRNTGTVSLEQSNDGFEDLALATRMSQLEFVALNEETLAFADYLGCFATNLNSIQTLVVAAAAERSERVDLTGLLYLMPCSLATLDIAARPFAAKLAEEVADAFVDNYCGVSGLILLRLPGEAGLALRRDESMAEAAKQLKRAATEAEARGVHVEWV